jgi:hypothetical protein
LYLFILLKDEKLEILLNMSDKKVTLPEIKGINCLSTYSAITEKNSLNPWEGRIVEME